MSAETVSIELSPVQAARLHVAADTVVLACGRLAGTPGLSDPSELISARGTLASALEDAGYVYDGIGWCRADDDCEVSA